MKPTQTPAARLYTPVCIFAMLAATLTLALAPALVVAPVAGASPRSECLKKHPASYCDALATTAPSATSPATTTGPAYREPLGPKPKSNKTETVVLLLIALAAMGVGVPFVIRAVKRANAEGTSVPAAYRADWRDDWTAAGRNAQINTWRKSVPAALVDDVRAAAKSHGPALLSDPSFTAQLAAELTESMRAEGAKYGAMLSPEEVHAMCSTAVETVRQEAAAQAQAQQAAVEAQQRDAAARVVGYNRAEPAYNADLSAYGYEADPADLSTEPETPSREPVSRPRGTPPSAAGGNTGGDPFGALDGM